MKQVDRSRPTTQALPATGALARGRAAYADKAWDDAYQALLEADRAQPLAVEDLDRLAWSAALTGRHAESLPARERQFQTLLAAGENAPAARCAFWIAFRLGSLGEVGQASGWLARAERLLEHESGECAEHGYLLLLTFYRSLARGDHDAAHAAAERATGIGDRAGDADLSAFARNLQGVVRIRQGRVPDGLAILDEAMLAATKGELLPAITGLIYCNVIECCQRVYAIDRASEWTAALEGWCDEQPQLASFTGSCRLHRAEILEFHGAWHEALAEARRASERFADAAHEEAAGPAHYQEAEVHRLRGEYSEAERAYRKASELGRDPQPGLALLRLAQGDTEAAASAIRRVLGAGGDPLRRARLLPAYVEIMLGAGAREDARVGASELAGIAASFPVDVLSAMSSHAGGAVSLADGDAQGALAPLRHAFDVWRQADAPYLAARLRVLIGLACRALGDHEGAALEWDSARTVFEELGAMPDLARMSLLIGDVRAARPHGLTARELEVLRLVATGKTNKVIAAELFVSEKTIDRHVSNIFSKLDVSSRAAATAYAYEHRLT